MSDRLDGMFLIPQRKLRKMTAKNKSKIFVHIKNKVKVAVAAKEKLKAFYKL